MAPILQILLIDWLIDDDNFVICDLDLLQSTGLNLPPIHLGKVGTSDGDIA